MFVNNQKLRNHVFLPNVSNTPTVSSLIETESSSDRIVQPAVAMYSWRRCSVARSVPPLAIKPSLRVEVAPLHAISRSILLLALLGSLN